MNIRKKLKEMGLEIPVASLPLAAYVPAVKTGKLVFTAGQLPMVNGEIAKTGKVGAEVSVEEAKGFGLNFREGAKPHFSNKKKEEGHR